RARSRAKAKNLRLTAPYVRTRTSVSQIFQPLQQVRNISFLSFGGRRCTAGFNKALTRCYPDGSMRDVRLKLIPAAIASAFVVTVPLPDAAESTESPRLVVPDVRDVTIKTRRSFDAPGSTVVTDILYLKGPWQRREEIVEFPKNTGVGTVRRYVTIVRCDERRVTQLNHAAR